MQTCCICCLVNNPLVNSNTCEGEALINLFLPQNQVLQNTIVIVILR